MPDSEYQLNVMDDPRLPFIIKNGSTNLRNSVPNWHENTEILLCSAGAGYFLCGETQYAVMPGDIVVANSEMLHSAYTDDYMEYHYLNIDRHFCLENGIPTTNLTFREFVQDAELSRRFLLIFEAKKRYVQTGNYYEVAAIRSAVLDFLYLLCKEHTVQQTQSATPHRGELVKTAVIYIRKHLTEPLALDAIAEHTGVNKHYLSRLFKQVLGKTVFETVRVLRCNEAKRRIEEGMPVAQAAHSCGFENLSYFTRTFKKYYNILPSHCRREGTPDSGK